MKHIALIVLFFLAHTSFSQVNTSSGVWTEIGNVVLTTVFDDADNGDGVGDGATFVDGKSNNTGQGVAYTFGGTMQSGESINISTFTYNRNSSYVNFKIELYNKTNARVLKTSSILTHDGNDTTPINTTLSYTAISADNGDVLQVRYIRTDNGNTARDFAIDNIFLTGPCPFTVTPDLPLIASNATIEAEISAAVNKFSDAYLGVNTPSANELSNAENAYAALNINVSGGSITGNTPSDFKVASFLKTFAKHLKFNPNDTNIKTKANNTVWLFSSKFCSGDLTIDNQLYGYEDFARPASLLNDFLSANVKSLFGYTLYKHSVEFEHFWQPTFDTNYQIDNNAINTDMIFNISDVLLAYSLWHNTPEERYRYMRAYKRFIDRFFTYTSGTSEGIKVDGSGFHHWAAYNNYMYAFTTAANLLSYLDETRFQVGQENYQVFRNAFYAQYIQANDTEVQALSTSGRNPQNRTNPLSKTSLKTIAIFGGKILGLSTADPIFAGMYNRIYGTDGDFNYTTTGRPPSGFFQFNHASAGVFRKSNWVAFNKGFTNNMWGAELYTNQNRYGRYQSYGALEIIYPGNKENGNGYDDKTWNWNYNPGTTSIRLPWGKLHGERARLDEVQQKRFAGTLNLKNKNSELLTNNHGDYGMFAMDFQELENQGFGTSYGSEGHNNTFTFKKSNFYFDDIIVSLGSGISNDDTSNSTITTLFQRIDNKGTSPIVNGASQSATGETSFNGDTWVLSNYKTGFYLFSENNSLKIKKEVQQTPNQNQTWSSSLNISNNPTELYYTGYIDHGKNPSNKGYEYILMPNSNVGEMQSLSAAIQGGNKPYTVHQKNANAHIVEHKAKDVWGYAFFNSASNLSYNKVTGVNASCLVMTENNNDETLLVSVVNPDIGFDFHSYSPSKSVSRQVTLKGEWSLSQSYDGVSLISSSTAETILQFSLVDGLAEEVLLNSGTLNTAEFEKTAIKIFPNPTNDLLNIQISDSNIIIKKVQLIDVSGRIIYSSSKTNTIQVGAFSKGIYFLNIQSTTGQIFNKKIIINSIKK